MILFDSHCHLNDEKFAQDLDAVIQRMQEKGVLLCTTVGSDVETSRQCLKIAEKYPFVFASAGVHPHDAKDVSDDYLAEIARMLDHPKCVAVGEIGLDYYYDYSPRDVQKRVLEEQIELAYIREMPVIYHVRDAHGDMLDILKKHAHRLPKGVIHCCSASAEMVQEYLNLGLYISFAGPVTFKNAAGLLEAARVVPPHRLMIETDSPYLAPTPHRGKRNEPANVYYVMKAFCELHNVPEEVLADITLRNTLSFYSLPQPEHEFKEGIFPYTNLDFD